MLYRWIFVLIFSSAALLGQNRFRAQLSPLDFQSEKHGIYFSGINQLESDGKHFYIAGFKETEILVINEKGRVLQKIGGQGGHPAEFGEQGVLAISVRGNQLWVIDMEVQRIRKFVDGTYSDSFRAGPFNVTNSGPAVNLFAVSDQFIITPNGGPTGTLADVRLHDGTLVEEIGHAVPFQLSERILGMNDTHWLAHGKQWVSIHKFFPLITVYDEGFQIVDQIEIKSPVIDPLVDSIFQYEAGDQYVVSFPVFSDAKIFRGDLFLMTKGYLHQVDLKSHQLKSITGFYGEGEDFKGVQNPEVTLYSFAFLDNGFFVTAHPAMLWNHDLWTAQLPMMKFPQN